MLRNNFKKLSLDFVVVQVERMGLVDHGVKMGLKLEILGQCFKTFFF
jgi:hypothetical protein